VIVCIKTSIILFCFVAKVVFAQEKEPFIFTTDESYASNVNEKILTQVYKNIGYKIEITHLPAARALASSNSGKFDGELYRVKSITATYRNLIAIPQPISELYVVVFTKYRCIGLTDLHSIKPYKVGWIRGQKFAEQATKDIDAYPVNNFKQAFGMLDKGRVDLVIGTKLSALDGLEKLTGLDFKNISMLPDAISTIPIYHFLHKKNESMIEKVNSSLTQLKEQGIPEKIMFSELDKILGHVNLQKLNLQ